MTVRVEPLGPGLANERSGYPMSVFARRGRMAAQPRCEPAGGLLHPSGLSPGREFQETNGPVSGSAEPAMSSPAP
ncbi:MAG TPA: hypothetical protein VFE72_10860, partial [Lysobacter sp.]|nr:hypothetical protein [Lysobacter sp.]